MENKKLSSYILKKLESDGLINRPELTKAIEKIA